MGVPFSLTLDCSTAAFVLCGTSACRTQAARVRPRQSSTDAIVNTTLPAACARLGAGGGRRPSGRRGRASLPSSDPRYKCVFGISLQLHMYKRTVGKPSVQLISCTARLVSLFIIRFLFSVFLF